MTINLRKSLTTDLHLLKKKRKVRLNSPKQIVKVNIIDPENNKPFGIFSKPNAIPKVTHSCELLSKVYIFDSRDNRKLEIEINK